MEKTDQQQGVVEYEAPPPRKPPPPPSPPRAAEQGQREEQREKETTEYEAPPSPPNISMPIDGTLRGGHVKEESSTVRLGFYSDLRTKRRKEIVVKVLTGGRERDRQGGMAEELKSLVRATRSSVAAGAVLFDGDFARNRKSSSAWNGALACQVYV